MNAPLIAAQTIRACVLGLAYAEDRTEYIRILSRLADELESRDQSAPAAPEFKRMGIATEMPGTNGGFTMAVFEGKDVPVGTNVYVKEE